MNKMPWESGYGVGADAPGTKKRRNMFFDPPNRFERFLATKVSWWWLIIAAIGGWLLAVYQATFHWGMKLG